MPLAATLSLRNPRSRNTWAALIFTTALVLRLVALGLTFPGNDAVRYYDDGKIALNLLGGNGFSINYDYRNFLLYEGLLDKATLEDPITEGARPTAVKQPAYALLLTGLFYLFGPKNFFVVFILHAVISSLTVTLLFLCLWSAAPLTALMAAIGTAIYPPFVGYPVTVPESTTLHMLLVVAIVLCVVKIQERPSFALWAIAGIIAGLAALTDPISVPFVALTLVYAACLAPSPVRTRIAALALAGAVVLLMISPWVVRNYLVFDRFPIVKTGAMGHVFVWGLKYSGHGSWIPDERILELEKSGRSLNEVQEEEAIEREVLAAFPSHWREYVLFYVPQNVFNLWWDIRDYQNDYSLRYTFGRRLPFLLLIGLALPPLARVLRRAVTQPRAVLQGQPVQVTAIILMCTYSAAYGIFGAFHSRYRLPIELTLFIFAGATLAPFAALVWNRLAPSAAPALTGLPAQASGMVQASQPAAQQS